ncbi:hypothetical protein [Actinophytocola sp. NPDC049390]|uniref:hypothetical protein n=1 Tax=Actinophytocola sp. NPDC049390 TaxID=3363894 RepID=UPI0037972DB7
MVVYRHEAHDGHERYRTAVVIGPALTEPVADRLWIGVRLPRHDGSNRIDLIDVATIIDVQPSQPGEPPSAA